MKSSEQLQWAIDIAPEFEARGFDLEGLLDDDHNEIERLEAAETAAQELLACLSRPQVVAHPRARSLAKLIQRAADGTIAKPLDPERFKGADLDLSLIRKLDRHELAKLRACPVPVGLDDEAIEELHQLSDELSTLADSFKVHGEGSDTKVGYTVCVEIVDGKQRIIPLLGIDGCVLVEDSARGTAWLEAHPAWHISEAFEGADYLRAHVALSFAEICAETEAGEPVAPNLLYFHKPHYTFHPDEEPRLPPWNPAPQPPRHISRERDKKVLTLDTGFFTDLADYSCETSNHAKALDPFESNGQEITRGHGPAIADLVGTMLGEPERSLLRTIDYSMSCAGAPTTVAHGAAIAGPAKLVRCFDTLALDAALLAVLHELQGRDDIAVVNLSLGALSCRDLMGQGKDPIFRTLRAIADIAQVTVAAGNHADELWSYPASYSRDFPGQVHSVGSSSGNFTATSSTITAHEDGHRVATTYFDGKLVSWSGTSFAAPKHAAVLAR